MTMLRRLMQAIKPNANLNSGFEDYYSKLLNSSDGEGGVPTAREAQRDLRSALDRQFYYL